VEPLSSNREFEAASRRLNKLVEAVLLAVVGAVITLVLQSFLRPSPQVAPHSPPIFGFFRGRPVRTQLLIQGLLFLTTGGAVLVIEFLHLLRSGARGKQLYSSSLRSAAVGMRWSFVNYVTWGGFLILLVAMNGTDDINLTSFFTAATLAATFHFLLCHISFYVVGEIALGDATEEDLYACKPKGLARLLVPSSLAAIGAGVFFSYFAAVLSPSSVFVVVYRNRVAVLAFLISWLLFLWIFFYTIDQNSFFRRALNYRNFFRVWVLYFICWSAGLLTGTALYERVLTLIIW
jgi:hypothetical protein